MNMVNRYILACLCLVSGATFVAAQYRGNDGWGADCSSDADCEGDASGATGTGYGGWEYSLDRRLCNAGACVECLTDLDCGGAACQCRSNSTCSTTWPNPAPWCEIISMAACSDAKDGFIYGPYSYLACQEEVATTEEPTTSAVNTTTPYCHLGSGTCVECTHHHQCESVASTEISTCGTETGSPEWWDRDAFKCSCKHHSDCDEAQYCALGGRCIDVAHCCEGLHDGAFIFATYRPPFDVEEGGECPASEKCCADDTDCTDGEVCDMSTHKCGENSSYVSTTAEESVASAWTAVVLGEDQLLQELLNQVCGDTPYSDLIRRQMECEYYDSASNCSAASQCSWIPEGGDQSTWISRKTRRSCAVNPEAVLGESYAVLNDAEGNCTAMTSAPECQDVGTCEVSSGGACVLSLNFDLAGALLRAGEEVQDVSTPFMNRTHTLQLQNMACEAHDESACESVADCTWDAEAGCETDSQLADSIMFGGSPCNISQLTSQWDGGESFCGMSPGEVLILALCGEREPSTDAATDACSDAVCTTEVCSDGTNPPVPEGECCGDTSLCPDNGNSTTEDSDTAGTIEDSNNTAETEDDNATEDGNTSTEGVVRMEDASNTPPAAACSAAIAFVSAQVALALV